MGISAVYAENADLVQRLDSKESLNMDLLSMVASLNNKCSQVETMHEALLKQVTQYHALQPAPSMIIKLTQEQIDESDLFKEHIGDSPRGRGQKNS